MKVVKLISGIVLLTSALGVSSVQADENFSPYLAIGGGSFYYDNLVTGQTNDTGVVLQAGADIAKYFGAEARFGATGGISATNNSSKAMSFQTYLAKVQYPFTPSGRVYGLGGYSITHIRGGKFLAVNKNTISRKNTGGTFGAGLSYKTGSSIRFSLDWTRTYSAGVSTVVGFIQSTF